MNLKGNKSITWTDRKICISMYLLVLTMMVVLGGMLNISYILDETGTVANAAFLAGYNWNHWVNSTGGYFYKYGQSIFYAPILRFVTNPFLIYKLMMFINGLFLAWIPVLSYKILRKHLKEEQKSKCVLLSLCISVVPATVLYSLFARADVMLIALAWVVLYFLLEAMNADTLRKRILLSGLLAFLTVYVYMCHSRGIVFVIAVTMIVFVVRVFLKEKGISIASYVINLILWLYVDDKLTHYFKNSIWGSGIKRNTFEKVNVDKYANIFTLDGLDTLLKNFMGWLFNSFLGTFGLTFLGIVFALAGIICFVAKKKQLTAVEVVINLYALLVYFGTVAMGMLFSFGSNYKFVIGEKIKRADRFLYSRYVVPAYAVLIFIALYYLFCKTERFKMLEKILAVAGGLLLLGYCATWLPRFVNGVEYSWRNTIDSAMFFHSKYGNDASTFKNVSMPLIKAMCLAIVILTIIIILAQKNKKYAQWNFVFVGLVLLASLSVNYVKMRFATDVRPMSSIGTVIAEMYKIEKNTDILSEYPYVYLDKTVTRHKMMQLAIPHGVVYKSNSLKPEQINNMFIVTKNNYLNEKWAGEDCYILEDNEFEKDYMIIVVKGEELKEELENRGVALKELPLDYTEIASPKKDLPFKAAVKKVLQTQKIAFGY